MAKSNKQQLDELLGIMDELKASSGIEPEPPENPIPDDLPREGELMTPTVPKPSAPAPVTSEKEVKRRDPNDLEDADLNELIETQKNLEEIDSILTIAKNVMQHVYSVVTSTDILDAATIAAAAKLISETRGLVDRHLEIQKTQREFLNKIQMEEIKHRHQMELMEKKFELEQKRFQQKNPALNAPASGIPNPPPAQPGMKAYSNADLMKMINEGEK